jgi:hypothetical protein
MTKVKLLKGIKYLDKMLPNYMSLSIWELSESGGAELMTATTAYHAMANEYCIKCPLEITHKSIVSRCQDFTKALSGQPLTGVIKRFPLPPLEWLFLRAGHDNKKIYFLASYLKYKESVPGYLQSDDNGLPRSRVACYLNNYLLTVQGENNLGPSIFTG